MKEITASPPQFAQQFNLLVPGAPRKLTAEDVVKLTELGLVKRHGYYSPTADVETIRAIMAYEAWRAVRNTNQELHQAEGQTPQLCRLCSQPLPISELRKGRPRAYCYRCEPSRARERYQKWRAKRRLKQKRPTEIEAVYN